MAWAKLHPLPAEQWPQFTYCTQSWVFLSSVGVVGVDARLDGRRGQVLIQWRLIGWRDVPPGRLFSSRGLSRCLARWRDVPSGFFFPPFFAPPRRLIGWRDVPPGRFLLSPPHLLLAPRRVEGCSTRGATVPLVASSIGGVVSSFILRSSLVALRRPVGVFFALWDPPSLHFPAACPCSEGVGFPHVFRRWPIPFLDDEPADRVEVVQHLLVVLVRPPRVGPPKPPLHMGDRCPRPLFGQGHFTAPPRWRIVCGRLAMWWWWRRLE